MNDGGANSTSGSGYKFVPRALLLYCLFRGGLLFCERYCV